MSAELTQGEIYKMLGFYLKEPPFREPEESGQNKEQDILKTLSHSIKLNGVHRTAARYSSLESPLIQCGLKLAAAGYEPEVICELLMTSVMTDKSKGVNRSMLLALAERFIEILNEIPEPSTSEISRESDQLKVKGDFAGELCHEGNIVIEGRLLSGSRIETSGELVVYGGISGSNLIAGKNILAPFIESSRIKCFDDVVVTSIILNSTIVCAGGIYCSPDTGSCISGGECKSLSTIQVDYIGSSLGLNTRAEILNSSDELDDGKPVPATATAGSFYKKFVISNGIAANTKLFSPEGDFIIRTKKEGRFVLPLSSGEGGA